MMTRKMGFWGLGLALLGVVVAAYFITRKPDTAPPIDFIPATRPAVTFMLPDNYAFRQDNEAWADEKIGTTDDTLYDYGCTIASVAMAASNLTETSINPQVLNAALSEHEGFTDRGWLIWGKVNAATEGRVTARYYSKPSHHDIDQCMKNDGYPVVKIKLRGSIIHWVTIVGTSEAGYLIRDPLVGDPGDLPIELSDRSDDIYGVRCINLAQ